MDTIITEIEIDILHDMLRDSNHDAHTHWRSFNNIETVVENRLVTEEIIDLVRSMSGRGLIEWKGHGYGMFLVRLTGAAFDWIRKWVKKGA